MIGIEAQDAILTYENAGLNPSVAFEPLGNPRRAVFHLTRGYGLTHDTETIRHAWTAAGSGPGQSKSGIAGDEELGFLQTQEVDTLQFYYAGEKRNHGSVTLDIDPRMVPKTCLDSEDNVEPWASDKKHRSFVNGTWKTTMGDHPALRCILRLGNIATNKPNFLFHVIDRRRYVTVLTFRLGTQFIPLRWFKWSIDRNVMLRWVNSKPKVHRNSSRFSFGEVKVGPPDSDTVRNIIKRPGKPFGNFLTRTVIEGVVRRDLTGRTAKTERFANVPGNFWT